MAASRRRLTPRKPSRLDLELATVPVGDLIGRCGRRRCQVRDGPDCRLVRPMPGVVTHGESRALATTGSGRRGRPLG